MNAPTSITAACPVHDEMFDVSVGDLWDAGWHEAALDYHEKRGKRVGIAPYAPEEIARLRRLIDDNVSLERAQREVSGRRSGAAASTVEALVFGLRDGIEVLARPDTQRRVSDLDQKQLEDVCVRIQAFHPKIAPAWPTEDVDLLISLWRKRHGEH